jgi:hypothetical protein
MLCWAGHVIRMGALIYVKFCWEAPWKLTLCKAEKRVDFLDCGLPFCGSLIGG